MSIVFVRYMEYYSFVLPCCYNIHSQRPSIVSQRPNARWALNALGCAWGWGEVPWLMLPPFFEVPCGGSNFGRREAEEEWSPTPKKCTVGVS